MTDNPQPPEQPKSDSMTRHDERVQRREERRAARGGAGAWAFGVILILLGLIFLAQNLGGLYTVNNWWALFILIPAVASFGAAWRTYQAAGGRLTGSARASLMVGLILTLVTAIFLFNLSWTWLGPLILILAGLGLLLNVILPG